MSQTFDSLISFGLFLFKLRQFEYYLEIIIVV